MSLWQGWTFQNRAQFGLANLAPVRERGPWLVLLFYPSTHHGWTSMLDVRVWQLCNEDAIQVGLTNNKGLFVLFQGLPSRNATK